MLYAHWSDLPADVWIWRDFSPDEPNIACPCCGEYWHDPHSLDLLQRAREISGRPFTINSGHRCRRHNRKVGGALVSQHLKIAFDISLSGHDPRALYEACVAAGFTTFGHYGSFLHTDRRPGRRWFTKAGRQTWNFLVTS